MKKLFAVFAFISFIAKLIINIIYFDDVRARFVEYDTELSPVGSPLLICRGFFSFSYTFIFIFYCIVKTFGRSDGPSIVSTKFYASFTVSCIFEAIYIGIWSEGYSIAAFVVICAACLSQYMALHALFTALHDAVARNTELPKSVIWSNRILVQSGLMFDCAWNSILAIINFSVVLCHDIGLSSFQASVIGLLVL